MKKAKLPVPPARVSADLSSRLAIGLLLAAIFLVYANTLTAPFIFDDGPSIEDNQTIRHFATALQPPNATGAGVAGRPLVNLSLAVNYAVSGLKPWSYHAANITIHALAALTLFGLARRSLESAVLRERFAGKSVSVAFGIALLWALHPLQTESVTCVIQRTESLVGLFYLATIYAFARASTASAPTSRVAWGGLSIAACAAGMATKEVMVTAPVVALLYDRTFVSGTFRGTLRNRWLHYGLIGTWALLFHLMQGNPMRSGTAGYDSIAWWQYLLTQCRAITLYLRLALWPHPLVLDYGTNIVSGELEVAAPAAVLLALGAATVYALWRKPVLGFLGAWFFIILAPSSSVVPLVTQTIAEHRIYLSLAALVALGVGYLALAWPRRVLPVCLGLGAVAGIATLQRNLQYQNPELLWRDNLARQPDNLRVHVGLAGYADKAGRFDEAVAHYDEYLRRKPDRLDVRINLARDLVKVGRLDDARENFETILRARPTNTEVRVNYGACLLSLGRTDDALRQFELVLRVNERDADSHFNLAETLAKAGRLPEALAHYRRAVDLKPDAAFMHYRRGDALFKAERITEAIEAYQAAVALQPDLYGAWANLGGSLMSQGRAREAARAFETALRLKPDDTAARNNLELARGQLRR